MSFYETSRVLISDIELLLLVQMDNRTLLLVSWSLQLQFLLKIHLYPIIAKIEQLKSYLRPWEKGR